MTKVKRKASLYIRALCFILAILTHLVNTDSLKAQVVGQVSDLLKKAETQFGKSNARSYRLLKDALQMSQDQKNDSLEAICYEALGDFYKSQDYYTQALQNYSHALKIAARNKNQKLIGSCNYKQGTVYRRTGDNTLSREYLNKALKTMKAGDDVALMANIYLELGVLEEINDSLKKAENFFKLAINLHRKAGDSAGVNKSLNNLAVLLGSRYGETQQALQIFLQLRDRKLKARAYQTLGTTLLNIGACYLKLKNYKAAESNFQEAMKLGVTYNYRMLRAKILEAEAKMAFEEKKYQTAYSFHERFTKLNDSISRDEKEQVLKSVLELYEIETKDAQIEALKKGKKYAEEKIESDTRIRLLLLGGCILLFIFVGYITLVNKKLKQLNLRLTESQHQLEDYNGKLTQANRSISLQKEELEKLNQLNNKIFSIIGHDLRKPMATLHALLNSFRESEAKDQEKFENRMNALSKTLGATLELLDNLLNWSISQLGLLKPRPLKLQLSVIADQVMDLYIAEAVEEHKLVINRIDEDLQIKADLNMLSLVIRNLISNAVAHTPDGSLILIEAESKDGFIECTISDTGSGFDPDIIEKLMHDVGNLSGTTEENILKGKGTGLGLLLCKEFIQAMNGTFRLENIDHKKGTRAIFKLPEA